MNSERKTREVSGSPNYVATGAEADRAGRNRLALLTCIMTSSIVGFDGAAVGLGLPAIAGGLHAGLAVQQWVVAAYSLALGGLLLVGGALGDIYDRWRVFGLGTTGFGIAALLCALAPSAPLLVAGRAVQGVAAALLVPGVLAIITSTFEGEERSKAIGSWTAWSGLSLVFGPVLGGILIGTLSWRSVFFVDAGLAALTVFLAFRAAPASTHHPKNGTVDVVGAILGALVVGGPVFALIQQSSLGWGDPLVIGALVIGVCALVGFLLRERRASEPLLPLVPFSNRTFSVMNLATVLLYGAFGVGGFFVTSFVQQVGGYSPLEAGLAFLPVALPLFVLSGPFGRLSDRFGRQPLVVGGSVLVGVGFLLMPRMDQNAYFWSALFPARLLIGLGTAMLVSPLTATVLGAADERYAGIASGVNNAVARVSGLLAIALIGVIISVQFGAQLNQAVDPQSLSPRGEAALAQARTRPLAGGVEGQIGSTDRTVLDRAVRGASVSAFHVGVGIVGGLAIAGGLLCALGLRNPHLRRRVKAAHVPGGALFGAHRGLDRHHLVTPAPESRGENPRRWRGA